MNAMRALVSLGILTTLGATAALAEDAPAKAPAADLGAVLEAAGVAVGGYLDVSYSHRTGDGVFASGAPDRVFDTHTDGFSLQQAALSVGFQPKQGFGAFVNLTLGNDADVIAPYDHYPSRSKFDVTQAYAQYAGSDFTVIAGKFVTLANQEFIWSPTDTSFSRSILFGFAIPFTHTGVRATFTPSDIVTPVVGLNNGWDDLKDTNTAKTVELGAIFAPAKALSVAATGYFGKERVGGLVGFGTEGQRSLVDVVATWNVTAALTLVLNYDWGKQANLGEYLSSQAVRGGPNFDARWDGLAGYLNFTASDDWRLSLRAEVLNDRDGYRTGVVQKWQEVTATVAYLPTKHAELRFELRSDRSDAPSFSKSNGTEFGRSQQSAAVEALYKL